METFLQGAVLGFREGLEASLVIVVILQYINRSKKYNLKKNVYIGIGVGVAVSLIIGAVLFMISSAIDRTGEAAKLWESGAGLIALVLITAFIIWMIKHGSDMTETVKEKISLNFSATGILLISAVMVAREGAEVAIFTFAGDYKILAILVGIAISVVLAFLIYKSLLKVSLKLIFKITLVYLILQAGYLVGYSVHEFISALKDTGTIDAASNIYNKVFDLSGTVLNHKNGAVGLPLNVLVGWYSKPEWIQFILQYVYTTGIFAYWMFFNKSKRN